MTNKFPKLNEYTSTMKKKWRKNYSLSIIDNGIRYYPYRGIGGNKELTMYLNTLGRDERYKFLNECYDFIVGSVSKQLNVDLVDEPEYVIDCVIKSGCTLVSYYDIKSWGLEQKQKFNEVKEEVSEIVKK